MRTLGFVSDLFLLSLFVLLRCLAGVMKGLLGLVMMAPYKQRQRTRRHTRTSR